MVASQGTIATEQWKYDIDNVYDCEGWQFVWGKSVPSLRKPHEGRDGGVVIMARPGLAIEQVKPRSEVATRLWGSGRFVHTAVADGDGSRVMHVCSAYGHTNARA